jgi:hypothetical protein
MTRTGSLQTRRWCDHCAPWDYALLSTRWGICIHSGEHHTLEWANQSACNDPTIFWVASKLLYVKMPLLSDPVHIQASLLPKKEHTHTHTHTLMDLDNEEIHYVMKVLWENKTNKQNKTKQKNQKRLLFPGVNKIKVHFAYIHTHTHIHKHTHIDTKMKPTKYCLNKDGGG